MSDPILMPKLQVTGLDQSEIIVLTFDGRLAISELYEFNVEFVSKKSINAQQVLNQKATLSFAKKKGGTTPVNGEITSFSQLDAINEYHHYKIRLNPHAKRLCHTRRTEVYLDKTIPQIIKQLLDKNQITQVELDLVNDHKPKTFVFQYNEYDWDFISRWLAYEGLFYYFNQQGSEEKLVITDSNSTLQNNQDIQDIYYQSYTAGSQSNPKANMLYNYRLTNQALPKQLTLKSYYYEQSSKQYTSKAMIDERGVGDVLVWAENIKSDTENQSLAKLISESYQWRKEILTGISSGSLINPGTIINHKNFKESSRNIPMLIIESHYSGSHKNSFESMHVGESHFVDDFFKCEYRAIDKDKQYRTKINKQIPRINGLLPGFVDHEGKDNTVQINKKGLYKFRLAISDANPGKGSDWVRKMESYIGDQYAFSLPLRKGMEVFIGFHFGNPDLPVLLGALNNSTHRNMMTSKSQSYAGLQSKENNTLVINEKDGKTRGIQFSTPNNNSSLVLGTNDVFQSKLDAGFVLDSDSSSFQRTREDFNVIVNETSRSLIQGNAAYYCKEKAAYQFAADRITSTKGTNYYVTEKIVSNEIADHNALTVGGHEVTHVKGITSFENIGSASYDYLGLRTQSVTGLDFILRDVASIDMTGGFNIKMTSGWQYEEDEAANLKTAPAVLHEAIESLSLTVGASSITITPEGISIAAPSLQFCATETTITTELGTVTSSDVNIAGEVNAGAIVELFEEEAAALADLAALQAIATAITEGAAETAVATGLKATISPLIAAIKASPSRVATFVLPKIGEATSKLERLGVVSTALRLPSLDLDEEGNLSFGDINELENAALLTFISKLIE